MSDRELQGDGDVPCAELVEVTATDQGIRIDKVLVAAGVGPVNIGCKSTRLRFGRGSLLERVRYTVHGTPTLAYQGLVLEGNRHGKLELHGCIC